MIALSPAKKHLFRLMRLLPGGTRATALEIDWPRGMEYTWATITVHAKRNPDGSLDISYLKIKTDRPLFGKEGQGAQDPPDGIEEDESDEGR